MEEKVKIRFRVKKIYEKSAIAVYLDGEKISTRKKRVFAPGEMEEILLKKQDVFDKKNAQKETYFSYQNGGGRIMRDQN